MAGILAGAMVVSSMALTAFAGTPTYVADNSAGVAVGADTVVSKGGFTLEFTVSGLTAATTAKLGFTDPSWTYQEWGDNVYADVTGDGTYTLTYTSDYTGNALVFVVDMVIGDPFDITASDYKISDVKVNGTAVNFIYGDLEEKGNLRLEIYNEYGLTKSDDVTGASTAAADVSSGDVLPFAVIALSLSALAAGAVVVTKKVSFER